MKPLRVFLSIWNWWIRGCDIFDLSEFYIREFCFRDENVYTQNDKSFVDATLGWVVAWVGTALVSCWLWEGHFLGWAGDIRGVWVVKPGSFSRSRLVAFLFLFVWSVGKHSDSLPSICRRLLVGGHKWCWLLGFMSGFCLNMGDTRQDWLGGLSFRCTLPCSHTPMPETVIGFRNLVLFTSVYRWWKAHLTKTHDCWKYHIWCWECILQLWYSNGQHMPVFGYKGKMGNYLCGQFLNTKMMFSGSNKYIYYSMLWVCCLVLGLKSQIWFYVWLAKRYSCTRDTQFNQRYADTSWACNWVRDCWVGITVCWKLIYTGTLFWFGLNMWFLTGDWAVLWILWFWPQYKLRIQQTIAMVWYRGNFGLLDWFKNSLVVLVALNSLNELWYNLCGVCKCLDVLYGSMRVLFDPQSLLMVLIKVCRGKVVQCPAVIVKVPKRLMVVLLDLLGSISNVSWKHHGLLSVNLLADSRSFYTVKFMVCLSDMFGSLLVRTKAQLGFIMLCSSKAEAHKFNIKSGYYLKAQIWTGSVCHVAQSWILIVFLIKLKTWACSVYMGPSLVLQLKSRVSFTKVHMVMLSLLKAHVWIIRWLHGRMKAEDSRLTHKGHFSVWSGSLWIAWIKYVWAARFYGPRCGVKHYRNFCNLDRIGKYMSLSQCDFRFFLCNPKRGCMVSYFWSPKHVLGMIRGNAPLMM
ncbi:hypothetical protein Hanom_Chr15g01337751 [Helianthus anomalus]